MASQSGPRGPWPTGALVCVPFSSEARWSPGHPRKWLFSSGLNQRGEAKPARFGPCDPPKTSARGVFGSRFCFVGRNATTPRHTKPLGLTERPLTGRPPVCCVSFRVPPSSLVSRATSSTRWPRRRAELNGDARQIRTLPQQAAVAVAAMLRPDQRPAHDATEMAAIASRCSARRWRRGGGGGLERARDGRGGRGGRVREQRAQVAAARRADAAALEPREQARLGGKGRRWRGRCDRRTRAGRDRRDSHGLDSRRSGGSAARPAAQRDDVSSPDDAAAAKLEA